MFREKFSLVFVAEQNRPVGWFGFTPKLDFFKSYWKIAAALMAERVLEGRGVHGRQSHPLPFPQVVLPCRRCKAAANVG